MLETCSGLRQCFASVMQKFSAAAQTLKPKALFAADIATHTFTGHTIDPVADGTSIIRDLEIFKSGSFRDSWGDQQTWTPENLFQMVSNFNALRDSGTFPDVPVRRDHGSSVDKIMGYFEALRTDGQKLVADLHITESSQINKLVRGTYRSRSVELGMYEDNDGAMFWPVVFGVAYVDIPAVEGLHSKDIKVSYFSQTSEIQGEQPVTTTPEGQGNAGNFTLNLNGLTSTTPTISTGATGTMTTTPLDAGATRPTTPAAPAAAAKFRINGAEVDDVADVQKHIDALELFAKDTQVSARKAFVSSLVATNKIAAPLEVSLSAMAVTLSEAQYAEFTKAYEAAPALSLLGSHGGNQTEGKHDSDTTDARADRVEVLNETIAMHRRAGMSDDRIQQSSAFKELAAMKSDKN